MSTMTGTAMYRGNASRFFQTLTGALKVWWVAYITWRMENIAITQLQAMSDRELQDIGLTRSDVSSSVMGARRSRAQAQSLRNPGPMP